MKVEKKDKDTISMNQSVNIPGFPEYGRLLHMKLDMSAPREDLAEALKALVIESVETMDFTVIVDQINRVNKRDFSKYQEYVPYNGLH